jgi:photosystem II stability/assembly factor-like uncharacterized protein
MRKALFLFAIVFISVIAFFTNQEAPERGDMGSTPTGRLAWEVMRLADPRTGEIPEFSRSKELDFAKKLPVRKVANDKSGSQLFTHIGPYNVGGRTRALAFDVKDPFTYFAGGVSGGLWRSRNEGETWKRVSGANDHAAVSCIAQDTRQDKTNTWYYGSGESIGNSASKSFSAYYRGSGMYKSTNGGTTWQQIPSTATLVNKASAWDFIFAVATDPSRNDSDLVYAAVKSGIMRSKDGGDTWQKVLSSSLDASFTNVMVSGNGVVYATIGSDGGNGSGFWRSPDGLSWTRISHPTFPGNHVRTVFDIYRKDENVLFFFSNTPGAGAAGASLWRYEYLSGNGSGSGASWTNLSANLPDSNLNLFNGYCMVVKIKPDNEDVIFIGGNDLYRALTGFRDTLNVHRVGGYGVHGDSNYTYRLGYQHPDQHAMAFHPNSAEVLLSSTDGGVHLSLHPADTIIHWESLNNGYITTQFYGIGIDHGTSGSRVILGGLQDQGTYWTNTSDPNADWVSIRGSDGAYVAVEDGGGAYYLSTQYANIRRYILDSTGKSLHDVKVMPPSLPKGSSAGWLFVHPFTLDPVDNNIMYLPYKNEVWRNDDLAAADSNDLTAWTQLVTVSGNITAITASEKDQGSVFIGTSSGTIYRISNAHTTGSKVAVNISGTINSSGYTSCIAVDPNDNDKIIVVFSNYNVVSLWYTENGGVDWYPIEGNLKGDTDPKVPPQFYYIGNGPSVRWAEIIPTQTGNRYFIGTSIGLFSTNELIGDSTVWMQEGAESIGNVVVDMLDFRQSDQYLAVGTHGNGIYTTAVYPNFIGIEGHSIPKTSLSVFPNPSREFVNIGNVVEPTEYRFFDQSGKLVQSGVLQTGNNRLYVGELPSGLYILKAGRECLKVVVGD